MPQLQEANESKGEEELEAQDVDALAHTRATRSSRKRARKTLSRDDSSNSPSPSIAGTVSRRNGRSHRTAGILSDFINMPLDIIFEVAAYLHPIDILNLTRTSKSFRSVLLAKNSRSAWLASLASVDALPSCPGNMSEPLYVALLFDHYCFLCAERARWVDYAIRLRLCKACYNANVRKGSAIVGKDEVDIFRTLPLFPCETGSDHKRAEKFAFPENRILSSKFYAPYVIATIDAHTSLQQQDREAAELRKKEMLEDVAARHTFAATILAWSTRNMMLKQLTNVQTMSDRQSQITARLQALGYNEADFPDGHAWTKLMSQPKLLTDRTWNNIRPKLEELLAVEKKRRAQKDYEEQADARLDNVIEWYEEYLLMDLTRDERDLMPNAHDARDLESLFDLAAYEITSLRDFRECAEEMLAEAEEYKVRARRELADVLRDDEWCADLEDVPDADVLRRPYAYFACVTGCHATVDGCAYFTYEQLHAHWRAAHPDTSWLQGEGENSWVEVPMLPPLSLPGVARFALEAVGIAFDTSREALDGWVREGRLFCDCGHPGMPLPGEMSWVKLLSHLMSHLHQYYERKFEMKWLGARCNPHHVLRDGHWLGPGDNCCVKFLPEGADTTAASVRTTVDDACRAQIEAKLAARPQPGAIAVCRICKGLARKTPQQVRRHLLYMRLPERAEEVVWHLRYCHGKEFEKRDILFVSF